MVIDEEWLKIPSIPQEYENEEEVEDEGTISPYPSPTHPTPAVDLILAPDVAPVAPEVLPVKLERLDLERVARIAEAPRKRNERA